MAKRTWMFLTLAAGMLLATPFVAMAQEGAVAAAPGSGLRAGLIALAPVSVSVSRHSDAVSVRVSSPPPR